MKKSMDVVIPKLSLTELEPEESEETIVEQMKSKLKNAKLKLALDGFLKKFKEEEKEEIDSPPQIKSG